MLLLQELGLGRDQVRLLTPEDFQHSDEESNVLRAANPDDRQFRYKEWRSNGVRYVIMSPVTSVAVDGLQFIEDLVMWYPPSGSLRQLFARFVRPAAR